MLNIGATGGQVALAAFLSGIASTIGAFIWRKLMDSPNRQLLVILASAGSIAASAIALLFISDISSMLILSAAIGITTAGSGPVTNMLIMKKCQGDERIKLFSWTSIISCAGLVIAMAAGYVWLRYFDAKSYSIICCISAILAICLALFFIRGSQRLELNDNNNIKKEGIRIKSICRHVTSLKKASLEVYTMISLSITQLLLMPSMIKKTLAASPSSGITFPALSCQKLFTKESVFFAGIGLYFLSGNLFFVPFTPFLKNSGVSDSEVFLAYTILHLSKVIFLPFNGRTVMAMRGEQRAAKWSYLPRLLGILLVAITALLLASNSAVVLIITLVAFVAIDIAFGIWSTTTTSFLMKTIPNGKEGHVLGINNGVIGAGALVGSLASAGTIGLFGYGMTFIISAIVFVFSLLLVRFSFDKHKLPVPPEIVIDYKNT
jgi:MFS family permease